MQKFVCDATPPTYITSIKQLTQAMGLPFDILSLADSKAASQKFLVYNFQKVSGPDSHFFTDSASIFKGNNGPSGSVGGQCFKCGRKCSASKTTPDISSGGFPCPPRFHNYASNTGAHPLQGRPSITRLSTLPQVSCCCICRRDNRGCGGLRK